MPLYMRDNKLLLKDTKLTATKACCCESNTSNCARCVLVGESLLNDGFSMPWFQWWQSGLLIPGADLLALTDIIWEGLGATRNPYRDYIQSWVVASPANIIPPNFPSRGSFTTRVCYNDAFLRQICPDVPVGGDARTNNGSSICGFVNYRCPDGVKIAEGPLGIPCDSIDPRILGGTLGGGPGVWFVSWIWRRNYNPNGTWAGDNFYPPPPSVAPFPCDL